MAKLGQKEFECIDNDVLSTDGLIVKKWRIIYD